MSVDFDPRAADVIADPYPKFHELMEHDPVHWSERWGGWVLTRHEHNRIALKDPRFSSNRMRPFFDHMAPDVRARITDLAENISLWAVFNDPPNHTRVRSLMNKAFTTRAIEALRPKVADVVNLLIDDLADRDEIDYIHDFAFKIPSYVMSDMLGLPRADVGLIKKWSDDLAAFVLTSRIDGDKYARANGGIKEMNDYFTRLIEEKRRKPTNDVLSGMVNAEERGDFLSREELVAASVLLMFAGHETTTHLFSNGTHALIKHPGELEKLRERADDTKFVAGAIEEMLRYDGPSLAQVRIMTEDMELEGRTMRKNERIFVVQAAANRDRRIFNDPDRFDLDRNDTRHLAFGFGIHFCIGAPLARMETQVGFPIIARRLTDLRIVGTPEWSDSYVTRGMKNFRVGYRMSA